MLSYLAVVIDLFSRAILGWRLSDSLQAERLDPEELHASAATLGGGTSHGPRRI